MVSGVRSSCETSSRKCFWVSKAVSRRCSIRSMAAATAPISSRFSRPVRRPSASGATSFASAVIDSSGRRPRRAANHAPTDVSATPIAPAISVALSRPSIESSTGCSGAAAIAYSPLSMGTTVTPNAARRELDGARVLARPRTARAERGLRYELASVAVGDDDVAVIDHRQQMTCTERLPRLDEALGIAAVAGILPPLRPRRPASERPCAASCRRG